VVVKLLHLFLFSTPDGGDRSPNDIATLPPGKANGTHCEEVREGTRDILHHVSEKKKQLAFAGIQGPQ